jgi:very-short-patch-repair endonuclease
MHVCVSTAELRAAGWSTYQIGQAVKCCLEKLRRGVYVVTAKCSNPDHEFTAALASAESVHFPHETIGMRKQAEDLRIRARSYVGRLPDGVVLSHRSALVAHGLPIPYFERKDALTVEAVHPGRGNRRKNLYVRYRDLASSEYIVVGGCPVTTVHQTLLDIARDYPLAFAVAVVDAAIRKSMITTESFREYCNAHPVRTRQRRIASVLDNIDERRESVGESICAVRFVEHSIAGFEPQVTILNERGEFVARTDFANESCRVIAEFDGAGKYYLDDADPKLSFEMERRREHQLRNLGYTVFRIEWKDLFNADLFLRIKATIANRLLQQE